MQEHLSNVSQDERLVLVRHKLGPKDSLLEYPYGVQVVAGSNLVAPIGIEMARRSRSTDRRAVCLRVSPIPVKRVPRPPVQFSLSTSWMSAWM
jgi:hypothetical protein